MLRSLSRPVLTLLVPLAALYGIEPAMAHHLLGAVTGPLRNMLDLVTRAH